MKEILEELFFNKYMARTIEHFILHEPWEQNQKDLCEMLGTYPPKMREILNALKEFGILVITRRIAKSKFYKLNKESKLIRPLRLLVQEFGFQEALKEAEIQMKHNQ